MPTQESNDAGQTTTTTTTQDPSVIQSPAGQSATPPATFEAWYETQDAPIKALIEARFATLENTVKATRGERDGFAAEIKKLAKTQAEGSEARKALDDMSAKLEVTERRADFMEEAMRSEIQCRNPRAAWLLAQAEGLFDSKNRPNWAAIRTEAPELFGVPTANANAGVSTQAKPPATRSMNDFIRAAAGRT